DQRGLFLAAATRLGTTVQNIEKDFWVCWTLNALFGRLQEGGPRLLFKGGTSLSKGYGLISRFSEDIDVTVFREDIGEAASVDDLEPLSRRKRNERLEAIKAACQSYINDELRPELAGIATQTMQAAGKSPASLKVVPDETDQDRQSLLIRYPSAVEKADYIVPSIKIESGAKSALDPHEDRTITPYLSADIPGGDTLAVNGVMTIDPERTFLAVCRKTRKHVNCFHF
ncbi:MAG: nucleotidyl transferase AbiEii/AbiGii toxin family protein, partial [Pseudolabrys sp.]